MQKSNWGLNKITITEDQKSTIRELVSKKKSGAFIAKLLKISQSKVWRQMEMMGLNKKKKKCIKKKNNKKWYFNWNDFKDNSII